jgi:hypothetical protein
LKDEREASLYMFKHQKWRRLITENDTMFIHGSRGKPNNVYSKRKTGNFALFSQREERKASDLYLKGMEGSLRDI